MSALMLYGRRDELSDTRLLGWLLFRALTPRDGRMYCKPAVH